VSRSKEQGTEANPKQDAPFPTRTTSGRWVRTLVSLRGVMKVNVPPPSVHTKASCPS